jgi:protein phosphatase
MKKIAIISDIHGNLESLMAVLEDIKERNVDKIMCLGDIIAKGSNQQQCIELIKNNCDIVLRGNCDEYFTSNIDLSNKSKQEIDRINWNKNKLTQENAEYLRKLPYCFEFYMSGRLVRLFHATPEKINDFVGNIDNIDRLYMLFLPSKNTPSNQIADIVIYGHIHTPFIQRIYNRTIINTGSVGNSIDVFRNAKKDGNVKNTTVANYLIISGNYNSKNIDEKISYELISIPYNIDKELKSNTDNIEILSYEEEIRNGKYRDMEKIYKSFEIRGIDKNKI